MASSTCFVSSVIGTSSSSYGVNGSRKCAPTIVRKGASSCAVKVSMKIDLPPPQRAQREGEDGVGNSGASQSVQWDAMRASMAAVALGVMMGMSGDAVNAEIPATKPTALLVDDANVVVRSAQSIVEKAYSTLKKSTGFEVHFVTVRSFEGLTEPNEYAKDLFERWGLGDKDVLVVGGTKVARAGIAAGADAKKLLSDDVIASIGNETFAFKARQEAYTASLFDVNNRLLPILSGKEDPGPPVIQRESADSTFKSKAETKENKNKYWTIFGVLVAISFIVPFLQYFWYTKN